MVDKEVINGKAPFSDAVKVGNNVYIAGQIAKDPISGGWPSDIEGQTVACLDNIKNTLAQLGAKPNDVVKMTIFLTDIRNFGRMNKAYVEFFHNNGVETDFPVRSVTQTPLMFSEWLIAIDCMAVLSER